MDTLIGWELERLDDWHHRVGCPGSWVFCDFWEAYVTGEYWTIAKERLRAMTNCFSKKNGF